MQNPIVAFRVANGLSKAEFGRLLGYEKVNPSRFCERIELGEVPIDADLVERIGKVTGGAVTAADIHAVRLAWLRQNRPDKFVEVAE